MTTTNTEQLEATLVDDEDLENLDYHDPREESDRPNDLEAIMDDDEREEALSSESSNALWQNPYLKIAGIAGASIIGLGGIGAIFMVTQPKTNITQTTKPGSKDSTSLNFGVAEDANKTEIALGKQRDAFAGEGNQQNPSPSPSISPPPSSPPPTTATSLVKPSPPVVQPIPKPALPPVNTSPKPVNLATITKPLTAPVVAKVIPVNPNPVQITKAPISPVTAKPSPKASFPAVSQSQQPPQVVAKPSPKAVLPVVAKSPQPQPTQVVAKPQLTPPSIALKPPAKQPTKEPLAKTPIVPPAKPEQVAKAPTASSSPAVPELSPEEQWQNLANAGTFGGRYGEEPVSSQVAVNPPSPSAIPVASGVAAAPVPNNIPSIIASNKVPEAIDISDPNKLKNEDIIPVLPIEEQKVATSPEEPLPDGVPVKIASANGITPSTSGRLQLAAYQPTVQPEVVPPQEAQPKQEVKEVKPEPLTSEATVLNGVGSKTYKIAPGTKVSGTLLTPIEAAGSSQNEQLLVIKLNQPILDQDGKIAVKADGNNTRIIFRWRIEKGWIRASSESLIIDGRTIAIPGVFALHGNDGQPLVAGTFRPGADEVTAADQNTFLLGAASKVGEILTAPDTNVVVNGGVFGGSTSTSTHNRNILGAVLQGGGQPVLQGQIKRNEQRSQAVQAREAIWHLGPGSQISIFTTTPLTISN
jgi:hypothetical protein